MSDEPDELPLAISDGGPHLFLPWDLVSHWHGVDGGVLPDFADTDYGRACDVPKPAGLLPVGPGQGLVIAGNPAMTYWVDTPNRTGGDLVVPRAWADDFSYSEIRLPSSFGICGWFFRIPRKDAVSSRPATAPRPGCTLIPGFLLLPGITESLQRRASGLPPYICSSFA